VVTVVTPEQFGCFLNPDPALPFQLHQPVPDQLQEAKQAEEVKAASSI
jgi:hypothetical protein